ncbi:transcriptional regulator [Mycobacterium sp. 852002-51163_SCH5372311]|uniref:PucR family transcriptional regulator n=1 Tax=Mycobacterium sp. 852002-51163_SCH5372311 TaxID=1834097 RepID=UPI0007FD4F18|nr:PucR family transcriptional regulator [Mycobacterium sp. 852002-51163_SCH5372311]OBF80700.1 transcriptional regulator [Mycobacterium sp. 852002-51163_SCH5372311]
MSEPALRFTGLDLGEEVVAALRAVLPQMAERVITAVTVEVPSYADAFSGRMGRIIEDAVRMALGAFLHLALGRHGSDPAPTLTPALDGAYELGRGEARQGRPMDALLSAYRVGARVAWRELSETAVAAKMPAETVARFAEMVFAFIDELSASSLAGHADELATTGLVRQRYLERLARQLLIGEPAEMLQFSADRADWRPPETLTAVLLTDAQTRGLAARFSRSTLLLTEDLPGIEPSESVAVLLVPDVDDRDRGQLRSALQDRGAVLGPARPWMRVESSYRRALRARELRIGDDAEVVDTDEHLVELVLTADREAAEDLRRQVLAPLAGLRPTTAERLAETLRSWLLHRGQRDAVAADLYVHAQTVRYRMGQLRELYGDRLNDPQTILGLTVALGIRSVAR